ncbi:MAG: hypothetical protein QM638_14265 [Nocardioides sp.]|uniref:hypothetical protein n=1 Tax=Nocardioides sp. TaxID=35761 RepID=UPI0039E50D3A
MRPVLVVGATGALRPAALVLVRDGRPVAGLSRRSGPDTGIDHVAADWSDAAALEGALETAGPFSDALVYAPGAGPSVADAVRRHTDGTVVLTLTSAAAAPPPLDFDLERLRRPGFVLLQLGWASGPRWHTPAEISEGALMALADGRSRVLGRVRPWSERPA